MSDTIEHPKTPIPDLRGSPDVFPVPVYAFGAGHLFNWCETHKSPEWVCTQRGRHK